MVTPDQVKDVVDQRRPCLDDKQSFFFGARTVFPLEVRVYPGYDIDTGGLVSEFNHAYTVSSILSTALRALTRIGSSTVTLGSIS